MIPLDDLGVLNKIWEKKLFIIDKDTSFREFLSNLLKGIGEIEVASNGQEALGRVKDSFFNVIVSEINMEKMNGIELYEKAIELNPHISRNFLFCSYDISPESKVFFRDNHLLYLEKPVRVKSLTQTVHDLIDKTL